LAPVIYSGQAVLDFERTIELSLKAYPSYVKSVLEDINEAVSILERHPLIGRRRDATRRELVISKSRFGYVAMYRYDVANVMVFVLRIRHQREAGFAG
jgi:plasmid stabilization system protein ParE